MDLYTEPSNSAKTESESAKSLTNPEVIVKQAANDEENPKGSESAEVEQEDVLQTYEGVTSDDFAQFVDEVTPTIQAIAASGVVIVWALFFCAGVLCVQTLLRSLEG